MSNTEIGVPQIYSATLVITAAGFKAAVQTANFNGTSKVISIVRITANGAAIGVPKAIIEAGGIATPYWRLGVTSSNVADRSTYQINWFNTIPDSYFLSPGIVNGVTAPFVAGQEYYP